MSAVPQISTLFNPYGLNRSRRWLRDLPVGLDITAPEVAAGSQSRSGECLLLKGVELGLRDGARVEKSFRRLDFAGRVAASRNCLDVLICRRRMLSHDQPPARVVEPSLKSADQRVTLRCRDS
jgi:hypothetical protein